MSLPAVPGLSAAGWCRRSLAGHDDAEVWVLVRRESLTRFERLATEGNQAWGERAKALVGDLTAANLGLTDEAIAELGSVDHIVHCAAIYDITAEEADQQAANVEGTRAVIDAGPSAGRHAASRVVDRGRRHLPRRVHRGRLRRRAGSADAVSPDEVRGRAAGPLGGRTALPGIPARGRRRRFPHRRDGQGRRPVLLLRHAGEAGRSCPGSPRSCCPTPAAPTSFRSTSSSRRSSH